MPTDAGARARAAIAAGDVLLAFDEATAAVEADPDDLDARFVAALALARSGATERAEAAAHQVLALLDAAPPARVPPALHQDAMALLARLAKDGGLRATGGERVTRLRHAADLYEAVGERFGGYFPYVNAATLRLLAGDVAAAHELARTTRAALGDGPAPGDDYWWHASDAEASLVLGDIDRARAAIDAAARCSVNDHAGRAVTRRQLRLVCDAIGADRAILDPLSAALVLHFCGHLIDPGRRVQRFPAELEPTVVEAVDEYLDAHRVAAAYGSLASGADIIVTEALLRRGVAVHVILPFDAERFEAISVAPAGSDWPERFHRCLDAAESVALASDSASTEDEMFGYTACIAMGQALNHASWIEAPTEQLAVWDGSGGTTDVAGTAHDIAVWRAAGHHTHVITLPSSTSETASTATASESPGAANRADAAVRHEVAAILFTDLRGYSRLRDAEIAAYVRTLFSEFARVLARCGDQLLWTNTWGDAIAAVFVDVSAAAECALGLQERLAELDLAALGLPRDLDLRIGAHAGPVMRLLDPVTGQTAYWGRELTRTARIEPRTPEGQVYVTSAFAALLALDAQSSFATEYMGRITTAKDFETVRMYRLRRRV